MSKDKGVAGLIFIWTLFAHNEALAHLSPLTARLWLRPSSEMSQKPPNWPKTRQKYAHQPKTIFAWKFRIKQPNWAGNHPIWQCPFSIIWRILQEHVKHQKHNSFSFYQSGILNFKELLFSNIYSLFLTSWHNRSSQTLLHKDTH